ncbi:MAG: response regulator [Acidobacteria bacterium]|nr:response regulator [Acidobacteriota bacterium]
MNLAGNAIKFTNQGSVSIKMHEESSGRDHGLFCIEVEDTGIGIESNMINLIFNKFVQADISTTRQYGGSGLGLAISKMLVEMMRGTLTADSNPGKGTVFRVQLPLLIAAVDSMTGAAASPIKEMSETCLIYKIDPSYILLAEDNKINQQLIASILLKESHRVDIVNNGREAVDKVKINNYDLVLMDVQMPVMDGLEAARTIRELGYCSLPIIALTASAFATDKEKCLASGMNDFISKPLKQTEFLNIIGKWLSTNNCEIVCRGKMECIEN